MPSENRTDHASDLDGEATAHPPFPHASGCFLLAEVLWVGLPSFCTVGPANFSRALALATRALYLFGTPQYVRLIRKSEGVSSLRTLAGTGVLMSSTILTHGDVQSLRSALSTCLCIRFFKASTSVVLITLPRTDQRPRPHQQYNLPQSYLRRFSAPQGQAISQS